MSEGEGSRKAPLNFKKLLPNPLDKVEIGC